MKLAREDRGMTLDQAAEALGVSARTLGEIERGNTAKPYKLTIGQLAEFYRIDSSTLEDLPITVEDTSNGTD